MSTITKSQLDSVFIVMARARSGAELVWPDVLFSPPKFELVADESGSGKRRKLRFKLIFSWANVPYEDSSVATSFIPEKTLIRTNGAYHLLTLAQFGEMLIRWNLGMQRVDVRIMGMSENGQGFGIGRRFSAVQKFNETQQTLQDSAVEVQTYIDLVGANTISGFKAGLRLQRIMQALDTDSNFNPQVNFV